MLETRNPLFVHPFRLSSHDVNSIWNIFKLTIERWQRNMDSNNEWIVFIVWIEIISNGRFNYWQLHSHPTKNTFFWMNSMPYRPDQTECFCMKRHTSINWKMCLTTIWTERLLWCIDQYHLVVSHIWNFVGFWEYEKVFPNWMRMCELWSQLYMS